MSLILPGLRCLHQTRGSSLQHLFAHLDAAEVRSDAFEVRPSSLLAGDDRATAYDPISYQVDFLLIAAFDHLGMLKRALVDHGMPIVAAYPLVRAALESAAQAIWLTTGGTRRKRVIRALHRVWNDATLNDVALRHLTPQRTSSLNDLRTRLDELLAGAKASNHDLDKEHTSITDIVIAAGRRVRSRHFEPITVWRLCSSMAHGNRSVSLTVLERRLDGPGTDMGGSYIMTTSYRLIADFVGVVAAVVDAALDARDDLNA